MALSNLPLSGNIMKLDEETKACFGNLKECRPLSALLSKRDDELDEDDKAFAKIILSDPLTGLPNRIKLIRDIDENDCPVLFLINVDGFSQINDFFGIENGDAILVSLADRLSALLPDDAFRLYKLHGDEYAVLTNLSAPEMSCDKVSWDSIPWSNLESIARHITADIERHRILLKDEKIPGEYDVALNVTIGIACARVVRRENLLTRADIALKTAKRRRKPFLFYKHSTATREQYKKNIYWAAILKDAVKSDLIVPYFQPIVSNKTGTVKKYESLVRLLDKQNNFVLPETFLELSKIVRMYPDITKTMIRKSLELFRDISDHVSINLSIEDILDPRVRRFATKMIKDSNMASRVSFEILESEGIENYHEVKQFIEYFKDMDCKIGIDDFGIGYSNFAHIVKLDVDFLKIDASIIKNIETDQSAQIIVKSIVSFARALHMETIAEHVHSRSIYETVKALGVDCSQGYFFGEPRARV